MGKITPTIVILLANFATATKAQKPQFIATPAPTPLRTIHDKPDHLTFQVPAAWTLATHDHELSSFHEEARTAPHTARLRYVVAIPENPFPASTFAGAHFYLSVTPAQSADQCTAQAALPVHESPRHFLPEPVPLNRSIVAVGSRPADHGHDETGDICTQNRDDVYTLRQHNACLRFDLAMNNFCSEASGARPMTLDQILDIRSRLEAILNSVHFDR
jgi:hypothetical protein